MNSKRIISVTITRMMDESQEAPHLGVYSLHPGEPCKTIDRKAIGDWKPGEYPYFIAAHSPEDTGNPQSVEQDYKRMEALSNGAYHLVGIQAEAEITLTGSTAQRLTSGGLWGVESDAGEPCMQTFEKEELDNLKEELLAVGFSEENIADAFAKPLRSQDY